MHGTEGKVRTLCAITQIPTRDLYLKRPTIGVEYTIERTAQFVAAFII